MDLVVIGGGITGAAILRDAAMRGLKALLVEKGDFAGGTSSATSKMIHGGIRYLAQGQFHTTWQSCRERDRLAELNPNLVRPLPFVFPSFPGADEISLLGIRSALTVYGWLGDRNPATRHRMLSASEVSAHSRDLRTQGLRGGGLCWDLQVDDARFVLETLKSARRHGGHAVNHARVHGFRMQQGRIDAVQVRDELSGDLFVIPTQTTVNAAGPAVDAVCGLSPDIRPLGLRPAKGVHLVVPRSRIHTDAAIGIRGPGGRALFLCPFDDVLIAGTTDTYTDEMEDPCVTSQDAGYLLEALNRAFPAAALTQQDLVGVYAGTRPLVKSSQDGAHPSALSRDYKTQLDRTGLLSVAGGKLTTHRPMAQGVVDRIVRSVDAATQARCGPCQTHTVPLRADNFERSALQAMLAERFGVAAWRTAGLVERWGQDAVQMLEEAPAALHQPVGNSRYLYAELAWSMMNEAPAGLADLLERRIRVAVLCAQGGLAELDRMVNVAGDAAGWDAARRTMEADQYTGRVQRRYRVRAAPAPSQERASVTSLPATR